MDLICLKKKFKSTHLYIEDAKYRETNVKSIFPFFAIFSFWDVSDFVLKVGQFLMNFEHKIVPNSKQILFLHQYNFSPPFQAGRVASHKP